MFPYSLNFLKYFGSTYGLRRSRFGKTFARSKNVLKNIAIDQESLINHLGIIKAPKKNHKILCKIQEEQKTPKLLPPVFPTGLSNNIML